MIPDEAVEAAAKALYKLERGEAGWRPFIEMPAQHIEEWLEQARAALEAAAPYMYAACGRADFGQQPTSAPEDMTRKIGEEVA